ncbi:hypothetical protein [Alkalimarinus alittae]|uniref:Uncharacterized protein n=1 Tax=Alkalimarinus alittae TaxID=2961619 RepID=A0ABY6N5F1_9ALTE|nr:hypothetical protein [Alkalimarinus alittae]UZE97204.1 hypothetical protein NKI27_05500 [Alkalimarinus alittae]
MSTELQITLIATAFIVFNLSYVYCWAMAATYYQGPRMEVLLQAMVFHRNKFKPEGLVYRRRMIYHQIVIMALFFLYGAVVQ